MKLGQAYRALSQAKTIQATKKILDVAAAAEIYARRQKLGQASIGYAYSIKIEALRWLGELLKVAPKNKGARLLGGGKGAGGPVAEPPAIPTLADLGLDKKTSAIAQQLAAREPRTDGA